jgi:transmembrane sensor
MSDSMDWRIIDRHLAGDATPADEAELRRWLAEGPGNEDLLNELRAMHSPTRGRSGRTWNVDAAWSRLAGRTAEERAAGPLALEPRPAARRMQRRVIAWPAVASASAAVVAAGFVAMLWRTPTLVDAPKTVATVPERVYTSARAQQLRLTLGDGTRVVLNAGSTLRHAVTFATTSRDVELEGEAHFDVVHDETRPFRVHARGGVAEDLGTRFVVRAYPESPALQVVVAHGTVSLARDGASADARVLAPGQLGRLEPDGRVSVEQVADVDRWTSWTQGALVLDGLSLAQAAAEIGRRFDVRVVVPDESLARRRVSARFRDEPLPRVLDALSLALGAEWSGDGVMVVIRRAR